MVALIRGINVGKAKRIAMADLRTMMGKLGFAEARTLLNSGNVVFGTAGDSPAEISSRIEAGLVERLGVAARVTVLTADELAEAVSRHPFPEIADNPSRLLVAVLSNPDDISKLRPLQKRDWKPEALTLGSRTACLWCPDGVLDSPLNKAVTQALGDAFTARNWSTMTKLNNLANPQ